MCFGRKIQFNSTPYVLHILAIAIPLHLVQRKLSAIKLVRNIDAK